MSTTDPPTTPPAPASNLPTPAEVREAYLSKGLIPICHRFNIEYENGVIVAGRIYNLRRCCALAALSVGERVGFDVPHGMSASNVVVELSKARWPELDAVSFVDGFDGNKVERPSPSYDAGAAAWDAVKDLALGGDRP